MEEILLVKCANEAEAANVTATLEANNIPFRRHDECNDQRTGAYGPVPGIAVYVLEKDRETALGLILPVLETPSESVAFCPRCGSENILPLHRKRNYGTALGILSIFLFILPCLYLWWSVQVDLVLPVADWIAVAVFASSLLLMSASAFLRVNCKCNDCGKRFFRK